MLDLPKRAAPLAHHAASLVESVDAWEIFPAWRGDCETERRAPAVERVDVPRSWVWLAFDCDNLGFNAARPEHGPSFHDGASSGSGRSVSTSAARQMAVTSSGQPLHRAVAVSLAVGFNFQRTAHPPRCRDKHRSQPHSANIDVRGSTSKSEQVRKSSCHKLRLVYGVPLFGAHPDVECGRQNPLCSPDIAKSSSHFSRPQTRTPCECQLVSPPRGLI